MTDKTIAKEFPVVEQLIHLNHAAVAPWPRTTVAAIQSFAEENLLYGSSNYARWIELETDLREKARELINAPAAKDIALIKNTSEGLSFVASGLSWNAGDNIVGIRQEFPSNRFVWQSLNDQGVEFRELDLEQFSEEAEQALMNLCDSNTRLLAISAVQYTNGFRLDLVQLGKFCRDNGILFSIDAIQQIGAIPFDVQEYSADFVIADGHKWMLGPEGLGIFYVNAEILDQIKPSQFGWHMAADKSNYLAKTFQPAPDARRFECGSPNMLGIHALHASLELLLEIGIEEIHRGIINNYNYLLDGLQSISHVKLLSDTRPQRRSGILTFHSDHIASEDLYRKLQANKVLCAPRGGGIRLSPHFYTPKKQLEETVNMLT